MGALAGKLMPDLLVACVTGTAEGIAKAKEVFGLHAEGVGATEIARRVGIGRASVYCILEGA